MFRPEQTLSLVVTITEQSMLGICEFKPILDGGGGKFAPPAGFLNIAQKPLGLGS